MSVSTAKLFPTASLAAAHLALAEAIRNNKPNHIPNFVLATSTDLEDRATHVERLIEAVKNYLRAVTIETKSSMSSTRRLDRPYIFNQIASLGCDLDLVGALRNAADDLVEDVD
jgi:hypothetical protein